jgi:hypothetical protein
LLIYVPAYLEEKRRKKVRKKFVEIERERDRERERESKLSMLSWPLQEQNHAWPKYIAGETSHVVEREREI